MESTNALVKYRIVRERRERWPLSPPTGRGPRGRFPRARTRSGSGILETLPRMTGIRKTSGTGCGNIMIQRTKGKGRWEEAIRRNTSSNNTRTRGQESRGTSGGRITRSRIKTIPAMVIPPTLRPYYRWRHHQRRAQLFGFLKLLDTYILNRIPDSSCTQYMLNVLSPSPCTAVGTLLNFP
jgi:hypothetical protein